MYELNIKVRNKIAAQTDKAEYVCGNSDYIAVFDFDSEWDAYDTKTARFSYNGSYTDVVFDGNQCPVPVITDTHCFHIGVYAGDLHTTTAARVPCRKSILCGGGSHVAPSEDVYNQLMQRMSELETPDWNQNDSTKKDYIKNRTHWVERQLVQYVKEGKVTDGQGVFDIDAELPSAGNPYTVVFDGETYTGAIQVLGKICFFGNLGLLGVGEDSGEPFVVGMEDDYCVVTAADADTEHTVSFSVETDIFHKLDSRYVKQLMRFEEYGSSPSPSEKGVLIQGDGNTNIVGDVAWGVDEDSGKCVLTVPKLKDLSRKCQTVYERTLIMSPYMATAFRLPHDPAVGVPLTYSPENASFDSFPLNAQFTYCIKVYSPSDEVGGRGNNVRVYPETKDCAVGFFSPPPGVAGSLFCVKCYTGKVVITRLI